MTPTRRAAYAFAGVAVVAVVGGAALAVIAVGLVIGAFMADVWLAREKPIVEREAPTILARGQPLPYSLEAKAGPSVSLTMRQPTPPDLDVDPALGKPPLAGSIVAHRRGHHVLAPVAVRSVGPLGLGAVHRSIGDEAGITVYPDVITARRIASAVGEGRFSEEGSRRGPSIGIGTEFDSIRDYVPDDDIRQVNWRASLRVGRPMSNQYRIDQDRDVICLVDAGRLMAAPLGEMTRLDAAVDAVAAIAALSALDDRERVTRILAHASVEVIEAGRGLLPERCVAAYLDVKARARL